MSVTLHTVSGGADLDAVRALCWAYRDFLLQNSEVDRNITETFYPREVYAALMDRLAEAHARPQGVILLARHEGRPVGCGMSHALDTDTCEIKRVFTLPEARGAGVAGAICQRLVEQARADGFGRVVLDTSAHLPAAQRLYARLGFHARGPYQPIPPEALPHLLFFEYPLSDPPAC